MISSKRSCTQDAVMPSLHLRVAKPTIYHNVSALNIVYPRVAAVVRASISLSTAISPSISFFFFISVSIAVSRLIILPRCHYAHVVHNHNDYVNALQSGARMREWVDVWAASWVGG